MLPDNRIEFLAEKVYFHHWPPDTPKWSDFRKDKVNADINTNVAKKHVLISGKSIQINDYVFDNVKKVGLTIPQFKRQSVMIFEGHCEDFDAHVHVTTRSENYLEIFYNLMKWRDLCFPDTPFLDSKN
ncbi:MAG: hypothetical protein COW27_01780 [Nitrosopumilales archaeon CG15_BIG_FIL_POST_REV_8_21_14_020_37_12]|nr:MAG: hypothetical protein COW27_01780 [Nitrosopumilales archaeon CG15_BIG_FIL_POST_REV_8_21_14_020_37_12]